MLKIKSKKTLYNWGQPYNLATWYGPTNCTTNCAITRWQRDDYLKI